MRFYWVRDRVAQRHFVVHWRRGADNLADYFTKHHSPSHHRLMRSRYLLDLHRPTLLIRCGEGVLIPKGSNESPNGPGTGLAGSESPKGPKSCTTDEESPRGPKTAQTDDGSPKGLESYKTNDESLKGPRGPGRSPSLTNQPVDISSQL
jgi:hypothetical protein